ncbi:hypothetical protein F5878DRAFT_725821 [Lentinula raphanica]|uniref:Uncharacterized protein n=1 Tax=Lentinula raphanica TaxID=153919 RepID=A0AA38P826_9AGAR|nr:hypothetical protein F5878DRAFT_725821 [Lentinula raphanica]
MQPCSSFLAQQKKLGRIAIVVFLFSAVALAMPIGSESESEFNANELSHPSSASPDLVYRDLVPHTEESSDSLPSYEDAVRAGAGVLSSSHTGAASSSSSAIIKAEVKCNHDANSEEFKKAVKTMSESKPVIDRLQQVFSKKGRALDLSTQPSKSGQIEVTQFERVPNLKLNRKHLVAFENVKLKEEDYQFVIKFVAVGLPDAHHDHVYGYILKASLNNDQFEGRLWEAGKSYSNAATDTQCFPVTWVKFINGQPEQPPPTKIQTTKGYFSGGGSSNSRVSSTSRTSAS